LSSDGTNTQWINVGSISAGSASSIAVNSNGDDSSQFVTFSEGDSGSQQLRVDAGLKYNPNDNELTAGSFSGSIAASNIDSGTLADARIPNLNASKINAGTLADARIPNLNASKINAGTFSAARIPTLNQNTSGTAAGLSGNPNITVTDITINGKLKDGDDAFGSSGQVLSSDGVDTKWINVGSISAGSAALVAVNATNTADSAHFIAFTEAASGNEEVRVDSSLSYNPNTNVLTAGTFSGSIAASNVNSGTLDDARIPNLNASKINAGTLDDARIPNLSGAKITSGTVAAARIDNLNASKINAGTLADARIPNLNASKINAGTLDDARIPNLSGAKITSGTVAAARIDNLSGGKITSGTVAVARLGSGTPSSSNFLRGDGSWQPVDVFVTGMILLWSGAADAVPTGWSLCDGQNNTPDLRNRFVVGASSGTGDTTYPGLSVNATGGSADATLVSHSHTVDNHSHSFSANTNNNSHNHSINDPGHTHNLNYYEEHTDSGQQARYSQTRVQEAYTNPSGSTTTNSSTTGISIQNNTHNHSVSGTTGNSNPGTNSQGSSASNANLPPYYALCYIMKD
jgi:hypothetical protein